MKMKKFLPVNFALFTLVNPFVMKSEFVSVCTLLVETGVCLF